MYPKYYKIGNSIYRFESETQATQLIAVNGYASCYSFEIDNIQTVIDPGNLEPATEYEWQEAVRKFKKYSERFVSENLIPERWKVEAI